MVTETHYRALLNFYFFLLVNEGMTVAVSHRAANYVQKQLTKEPSQKIELLLIRTMVKFLEKYRSSRIHVGGTPPKSDWKVKNSQFVVGWKEFLRTCESQYSVILVLRYLLSYQPQIISEALDIPVGTVYFRLGRGLEAMAKSAPIQTLARMR